MINFAKRRTLEIFGPAPTPPDRPSPAGLADQRYLSDDLRRDLGLLDGRRTARGVRWH